MAKGYFVVFTNPTSEDRDGEFNQWYNEIHAKDIVSLAGFSRITRFRAREAVAGEVTHKYLALYECDDLDLAFKTITAVKDNLDLSDTLDEDAVAIFYEEFFSLHESELKE